jgi:hypothetical protein
MPVVDRAATLSFLLIGQGRQSFHGRWPRVEHQRPGRDLPICHANLEPSSLGPFLPHAPLPSSILIKTFVPRGSSASRARASAGFSYLVSG